MGWVPYLVPKLSIYANCQSDLDELTVPDEDLVSWIRRVHLHHVHVVGSLLAIPQLQVEAVQDADQNDLTHETSHEAARAHLLSVSEMQRPGVRVSEL